MSKYNLYLEGVSVEAVFNKLGGVDGAKRFLADEIVLAQALKPEHFDFIVRLDPSVKPSYPDSMKKLMHPELQGKGPAEYELNMVVQWFYEGQKDAFAYVDGCIIYKSLKKNNAIADQLGLQDLLAIQAKGIRVFRKLFNGKAVFAWKSVIENQDGDLSAPFLIERDGEVVLSWFMLYYKFNSNHPALCFPKKPSSL